MRWPRIGIVVGVMGLVLLGAGWWLTGVGAAGPTWPVTRAAAVRWPVIPPPPDPLLKQLQQYLSHSAQPRSLNQLPIPPKLQPFPRSGSSVHGSTCFVAGGFCSLTPCVVPVATAPAPSCTGGAAPQPALVESRLADTVSAPTFRHSSP
jgi:hypothetical protein